MKKSDLLILFLITLIGILGAAIYFQENPSLIGKQEVSPAPLQSTPVKKPIVHYPVPEVAEVPPQPPQTDQTDATPKNEPLLALRESLPSIQESDQALVPLVDQMIGKPDLVALVNLDSFIQRFVALVDDLPGKKLPRSHLPIKPPSGNFIVSGTDAEPQTSSRNHKRYQRYVELLERIDPELAIQAYIHLYPLFQRAYEQLGYKNAYFNDRLVFTLDHLLGTPQPKEPILLEQPSVLYTYADPLLENRSAGQKILLRIGPENRLKTMRILNNYHQRLMNLHP